MRSSGQITMNKKEQLIKLINDQGYSRANVRWVPKNPYGKKSKLNGWIFKLDGDEWKKLGNNFEEAVKEISLL